MQVVNPDRIPGKVTVIGRYGADKVTTVRSLGSTEAEMLTQVDLHLPGHIETVKATDHPVVWQCDAMVSPPLAPTMHDHFAYDGLPTAWQVSAKSYLSSAAHDMIL